MFGKPTSGVDDQAMLGDHVEEPARFRDGRVNLRQPIGRHAVEQLPFSNLGAEQLWKEVEQFLPKRRQVVAEQLAERRLGVLFPMRGDAVPTDVDLGGGRNQVFRRYGSLRLRFRLVGRQA